MKKILIKADSRITLLISTESGKVVEYEVNIPDLNYVFDMNWLKEFCNDDSTADLINATKTIERAVDSIIDRILDYQYDFMGEYMESDIITDLPTAIIGAVVTHVENKQVKKQEFYWGD